MSMPERPGTKGFWIAGCLPVIVFLVGCTVFGILAATGKGELGSIAGADGSITLHVDAPGEYKCFAEGVGIHPQKALFEGMDIVATSAPGGAITVGRPSGTFTYTLGDRHGVAIRTISFPDAGQYTLQTVWTGVPPPRSKVSQLAIGQFNLLAAGFALFGTCCGVSGAVVLAIIIALLTWKRRADWDKRYSVHAAPPMARTEPLDTTGSIDSIGATDAPGAGDESHDSYRPPLDDVPPPDEGERLY
jgi:hypothetical protein